MISPDTRRKRILVVEDEPAIYQLCQRVLTEAGFDLGIAANGKVAQSMISQQDYDLYLIDIKMPLMNGKELYQWLVEKHPQLANRVIFTTGSAVGKDTESFLQSSGRPVLRKPFTTEELKKVVNEYLGKD